MELVSQVEESARTRGVLDVDGHKERLDVKNTHVVKHTPE